jgi:hypothetical protein
VAEPLTETHRRAQLAIRARVLLDLKALWPAMDWEHLDRTYPAWATAVGAIVEQRRTDSANLAAAYLRAFRTAAGIPGRAPIVLADPVPAKQLATSLRVTAVYSAKSATARGVSADQAMAAAFVRSAGAITRMVLDGGRDTITSSLAADNRAAGWERVTDGDACAFCAELAGHPSSSSFQAHDGCGCSAEPIYR